MEKGILNILWLYPDILNLHGDRGNIMALEKIGKMLDLNVKITRVNSYNEEINFDDIDIIVINPGEVKVISKIVEVLNKQKEKLTKYIEDNKIIIVIGTSGAIMAKEIEYLNGNKTQGLGYLDMTVKEREYVYGNDIVYVLREDEKTQIVGNQIQLIDTQVNPEYALGITKYGKGNNSDGTEGAKYKNLIFTNALGPVLVKNPWYAEKLIRQAMNSKHVLLEDKKLDYGIEEKSLKYVKKFISKKGE